MEEERKEYGIRKVNNKHWYKVYKSGANGKTFYKILIAQKDYQGNVKNYYQNITFKKSLTPPNDGDQIRLIGFIENFFGDDIYNPKYSYTITDFETKQNQESIEQSAIEDYGQTLAENENNYNIDIDSLPF